MGKNTINTVMKKVKENSPLEDVCPERRLPIKARKSMYAEKAKSSGVTKCKIKNISARTR